jgi:hypothetical protein
VVFLIANQRVGDIAEGALDGVPVADQDLPFLGFGLAQIISQVATIEQRLRQTGLVAVYALMGRHVLPKEYAASPGPASGAQQRKLNDGRESRLTDTSGRGLQGYSNERGLRRTQICEHA